MLIGACVLVADSLSGFNEGAFRLKSLGEWWFWADPDSLQLLQPAIERHISPYLFDPYVLTLLEWPASIQFIVLGALLWFFGRSPWRRIEKSRL
jgi:hypothetical protein